MKKIKTIRFDFATQQCQGNDCKSFKEIHEHASEYDNVEIDDREYDKLLINAKEQLCEKDEDLYLVRDEIYKRADKAFSKCMNDGKGWDKAMEAYRKVEKEWLDTDCPFYEVE